MEIASGPPISEPVRQVILTLVQDRLRQFGLERVAVDPAVDYGGDPVLAVRADFGTADSPVTGDAMLDLMAEPWPELVRLGEDRFPHIQLQYPEEPEKLRQRRRRA